MATKRRKYETWATLNLGVDDGGEPVLLHNREGGAYRDVSDDENAVVDSIYVDDHDRPWVIQTNWMIMFGRPEPISLHVSATGPYLTADGVRRIPLGDLLSEAREELRQLAATASESLPEGKQSPFTQEIEIYAAKGSPQRGRQLGQDDLEEVARVYRHAWMIGVPVNEAVREAFTLSKDGAAKRIMAARKAGLLDGVGPKR
jgi:hypothetical protein